MKRLLHLQVCLACLLLISHFAFSQNQNWHAVNLDDSTTMAFPGRVVDKEMKGGHVFSHTSSEAIYSAVIQKGAYDGNPIDSELNKIYAETLEGMMRGMGGGVINDKRSFTVGKFSGLEARFSVPTNSRLPKATQVHVCPNSTGERNVVQRKLLDKH